LSSTESEGATASRLVTPTLRVGEVIADRYRLERLLGSGGMAEVYAAVNVRTEKRVALKWIHPAISNEEARARFAREALAAGRIHHPNVVTIFDVVEHQGSTCLIMELLEGETLAKRMLRAKQMPLVEAVALIWPAMRGVAAAHAQGVVHRDLKPDNIFICLDANGLVRDCKVLDFGVSKLTAPDGSGSGPIPIDITLAGNLVGTPAYMAPEQVRGSREIDQRADVYSLGVVFYEMLAGRLPFVNELYSAMMVDIATTDAPPVTRFRPDVPRRIAQVLHRALERNLERRFPDVPSFMHGLEEAARDELLLPAGTPPEGLITQIAMPRLTPSPLQAPETLRVFRLKRSQWAQLAVITLLGAAAVLILSWRGERRQTAATAQNAARPAAAAHAPVPAPAAAHAAAPAAQAHVPAPPVSPAAAATAAEPSQPAAAARAPEAAAAPPAPSAHSHGSKHEREHTGSSEDRPARAARVAPAERPAGTPATSAPQRTPRAGKLSVDDF
jgi:serine/threonine-protein kinase